MKASRDATIFIDLSYLSPEEEALIQKVLLRDEDLKKLEMGRVRRLRESVPDPRQLKELTGEWFEDLKSKRHGRQPHVSAVVRSSMRWKKSTGQRSNPFLKALPEEKAGEKNETLPELFTDPRLIHPALTVQQDNKDEAIVLEVIEAGHQSEVKHQDQKLEKELKAKELNTQILDPWRSAVKEDWAVETRPKQTNGKKGKDFEMRSFSDSDEISNWESDESDQPQSNVVLISSKQRTEFGYADNPSDPKPEVLMNSVFGFEEIMQSPIPQRRSREEIRVRNVVNRQTTPVWTDELVIDSNVKNNQVVFEDRKTIPVISVNTPAYVNLDQKVLDPEQKGKERVVEEILVADIKQRSPVRTEEIVVDIDVEKNPDFLKRPVSNVNASKNIHLDPAQIGKERVTEEIIVSDIRQRSPARPKEINADMIVEKNPEFLEGPESSNLDPVQKGKERVVKEIVITDVKRGSPTRPKEVIVDFDVEQNPDSLKNPVSNVNTSEITGLNQSLDPDQKRKERIVEEIIVADFKQRSPTRTEEISVDRNVGKNPDFPGGPVYIINTSKSPNLDPLRKGKERVVEEIVVSDFKQRSPARTEEINVDRNVGKDLEFFEDPVYTINAPKDASSEPDRKGKERVDEEIVVADFKRKSPTRTEEINVDRNVGKDLEFLEEPVYTINAPKYVNPDQKGKEPVVEEIVVADFKRRSPTWTKEINVDGNVGKDLEVLEDPVYTINAPKSAYSDPGRRGKERVVEEIVVADVKRRSPTRSKEQIVDVESNPDIPELSIASGNTERLVKWDKNGKEKAIEEILVDDFKRRSPARTEELIVDVIVEANSGAGVHKNEDILTDAGSLSEPGLNKYRNGGGSEFESESIKKAVEEIGEAGPGVSARDTEEDEGAISDSEILAGVYARATRPKMGIAKKQTAFERDQVQESADVIPTIVIVPSEPEETIEMEGVMKKTPGPEVLVEVTKHVTDTWEDESVDSDGDSSSVSSQDSDISGKKGQLSASTLSVTERTASLLSVYSDAGDFGNVAVQGSVEFAIMYSPLGELVIMVEQCQDLAIANPRKQRTDPYVKTYLYPDKRSKRKTSIKKRTVSPVYVESLRYKVKREELRGKILNLSVWHNDSRGRNAFLGQVEIILKDWDWKHEALTWYNLQPKNADNQESQEYRGILFIALKYMQPEATGASKVTRPTGEIHIWLREARQLRRLKSQAVDSFVKCYMLPDTSKKSRQKTRVVKKTQDPVYNHTMVYDGFRAGEVGEACCELTVWDNNKLSNQFLGGVRLSLGTGQSYGKKVDWMDSEREEVEIWKKMIANPNSWVEAELPLRSSMTPRQ